MNERKLKKQWKRDADRMLSAKKETMTAFYQPHTQTKQAALLPRRLVAVAVCALVLISLFAMLSLQNDEPSIPSMTSGDVPSAPETESSTEESVPPSEELLPSAYVLTSLHEMDAAVVEILSEGETVWVAASEGVEEYRDLICNVLYYHGGGTFDGVQTIRVRASEEKPLHTGDVIFFGVRELLLDGETFVGPYKTEYLHITDGRLCMEKDARSYISMVPLSQINSLAESLRQEHEQAGKQPPAIVERVEFVHGMTVGEIITYYEEIDRLYRRVVEHETV